MKMVQSTIYAASVLREIGGRCAYYIEHAAEHGDEAAHALIESTHDTGVKLLEDMRNLHAEIVKALADLNEPFAANEPTTNPPLSAS